MKLADVTKLADPHHGIFAKHLHQSNLQNAYKQPILPKLFLLICINKCNEGTVNLLSIFDNLQCYTVLQCIEHPYVY